MSTQLILQKLEAIDRKFDSLENKFDGLEGRFDGLEGRFDGLEGRFDGLETKLDEFRNETISRFDSFTKAYNRMDDELVIIKDNVKLHDNRIEKVEKLLQVRE